MLLPFPAAVGWFRSTILTALLVSPLAPLAGVAAPASPSPTLIAQAAGGARPGTVDPEQLSLQAQERFDQRDYTAAIALWTQLILANPPQAILNDTLFNRAKAYLLIVQPGLALADLNTINLSLRQSAQLAEQWLLKGIALSQLKKYEEAVVAFNNSDRLQPNNPLLYSNRADTLQLLGRLADAKKDIVKSISLKPTIDSYYKLGVIERFSGNHPACIKLMSKILVKNSSYIPAYLQRGLCLAALNRHDEAVADMLRVLKISPTNVQALEQTGLSLAAAGKLDAAKAYLLQAANIRLSSGETEKYQQLLKVIAGLGNR